MHERMSKPKGEAEHSRRRAQQQAVVRRAPLQVGAANDSAEREADSVADRVVENLGMGSPVVEVTESRVQRKATGAIGPEGGEVDADTEARLDRSRGGGSALDPSVRRSMESAFGGASFGDVRIHSGGESADLNTRLGAQAFTVDKDIYLGSGTPSPSTPSGQHLLAHELAHTQQQSGGAQRSVVQRLAHDKPIKNVTKIDVMQGGSSGLVAEVSDGKKPIIVKTNQANAAEVIAADKLMRGGKFSSGRFKVKAPKSRIIKADEIAELKTKAAAPGVLAGAPRKWVAGLDGPSPSLVAESLGTSTLDDAIRGAVAKPKGDDGQPVAGSAPERNEGLISDLKKLFTAPAPLKVLGKAMAADAAMGMGDRLLSLWNPANFGYDPKKKTFSFVDNTASTSEGSLVDKMTTDGLQNARSSFNDWAAKDFVVMLGTDLDRLAEKIVLTVTGMKPDLKLGAGGILGDFQGGKLRNEVGRELQAIIAANYPKLVANTKLGLDAGRKTVIKSLADPLKYTRGLSQWDRLQASTSLMARHYVLTGSPPDAAWDAANAKVLKLLKLPFKPAVPAFDQRMMPKL